MTLPDTIELSLSLPGLQALNPMIDDFVDRVFELAAIPAPRREQLHEALLSAVQLVEHALEADGDLTTLLDLHATVMTDCVEFRLLEHGVPMGDDIDSGLGADIRKRIRPAQVFDKVYWVQKGQEGSELHLVAHRDATVIEALENYRQQHEHHDAVAHADVKPTTTTAQYAIRGYRAEDGLTIARKIYDAYGRSYPNPDLYIPDRIERLNREGRLHSILCTASDGEVVGHFALERPDLGPIGESGQAVIDHRHRGHGLMGPMRAAVEAAGADLGLLGIWSQPTARHPVSQRMNLKFGSFPSALCLGTTPAAASLRGGVSGQREDTSMPARHSCFLYWHPLTAEPPVVAYVPSAYAPLIERLYAVRGRIANVKTDAVGLTPSGHSPVHTRFDNVRSVAWVTIDAVTTGSYDAILAAVDAMEKGAGAATIFIDLPIDDPGTADLSTNLLATGIRFAGIGPRFRKVDDARRAEDVLRLQHNPAPVDIEGLVVEGEIGQLIADAVFN